MENDTDAKQTKNTEDALPTPVTNTKATVNTNMMEQEVIIDKTGSNIDYNARTEALKLLTADHRIFTRH